MPMFADLLRRNGLDGNGLGRNRAFAAAALAAVLLVRAPAVVTVTAQRPTFRSDTEAVWVTATVIDKDGRLVTDLTRGDFEVLDNGVARDITVFRNDTVPFAITILFDVSASMLSNSYTMRQAISELVARFQRGDRAAIGAFGLFTEMSPRFTANAKTLLGWVSATVAGVGPPCAGWMNSMARGWAIAFAPRSVATAIWNAIVCGIDSVSRDAETPRRVVMVITDGLDNVSVLTPEDVQRYAAQFGVMVYVIGMFGRDGIDDSPLRTLAENTGGGYFRLFDRDDLPRTFAQVAEELRHQYVFGVTPAGNGSTHKLDVRVRRANAVARARRVYMEAAPVATIPVATTPSEPVDSTPATIPSGVSGSVLEAMDRYERGDPGGRPLSFDSVRAFSSSFESLRKAAPAWIRADPSQQARRRLAIATYALDLINANPNVVADGPAMRFADEALRMTADLKALGSPSASDVVAWACSVLRAGSPLPAEPTWHVAAIAALARVRGQSALDSHIAHAASRV